MTTKDMILADAIEVYIEAERKLRKSKRLLYCLIASNIVFIIATILMAVR